ncbi:MAG: M81 family metallopeptidase, partial [Alphaproteobacteria bacterium]|nr:M81 family metallopeptidase [Alphaproteobacteria bacterium]
MQNSTSPRVAILGFSIECNKFAPSATRAHFTARTYLEGDAIAAEARMPAPRMLAETPGFVAAMDASGPWTPVGIALAMTEPNGPVEHEFFIELIDTIERRLRAALPVEAVYVCSHGAALTTEEDDPDGLLFERVREIVGPGVPIAATLDLHANVSERMVRSIDAFIGYRTNPHLDMRERGAEAASAIREMLAGLRPQAAFIRLPIVPPTVTLLTAAGPYAEMIDLGQRRMTPEILNVSVMGGFAFADTADNGLAVVVTARHDKSAAEALAREIAELGWANRARFYPRLTPLDEAVEKAVTVGRDRSSPALAFADVADNPGGGGRGNTTFLLRAFYEAGVADALLGVFYDPPLAAEAHGYGLHYRFDARFNREEMTKFSDPWTAPARVAALTDGNCIGR